MASLFGEMGSSHAGASCLMWALTCGLHVTAFMFGDAFLSSKGWLCAAEAAICILARGGPKLYHPKETSNTFLLIVADRLWGAQSGDDNEFWPVAVPSEGHRGYGRTRAG